MKKTILIIWMLLLVGCSGQEEATDKDLKDIPVMNQVEIEESQEPFMALANRYAKEQVQTSSLNASFIYGDLEAEGLGHLLNELDDYNIEDVQKQMETLKQDKDIFESYDRDQLTEDEQMIYDMILYQMDVTLSGEAYLLYTNNFNPSFGLQVLIPLTLAQLELETELEIEGYLNRLSQVPDLLDQAILVENIKVDRGLALPGYMYDLAAEQVLELIETPETFLSYQSFADQLDAFEDLNDMDKAKYIEACLMIVKNEIFPAYEKLNTSLIEIGQKSQNKNGTSEWEDATGYYEWILYNQTSYKFDIDEMLAWLTTEENRLLNEITYMLNDDKVMHQLNKMTMPNIDNMEEATVVSEKIADTFFYDYGVVPADVKVIPTYLEDYLPSGFYFAMSIDQEDYGTMYLQEGSFENIDLNSFDTLIHEHIPGHHFYFSALYTGSAPFVQQVSDWGPYSEGWAVYIQQYSLDTFGFNQAVKDYYKTYMELVYIKEMIKDIQVHTQDLSRSDYIGDMVMEGYPSELAEKNYNRLLSNPGETFKYYFSAWKFEDYRDQFMNKQGDSYDPKVYHDFLLKHINIPFSTLDLLVEDYLNED